MACGLLLTLLLLAPADDSPWATGSQFRAELAEPLTANWLNVPLKSVLERISLDRRVMILLDRRIDPTQQLPVEFLNEPLEQGLATVAQQFAGGLSLPDGVVYLGPKASAAKLRTLIALRTAELATTDLQAAKDQQRRLLQRRPVTWEELDSPREILERLLRSLELTCENSTLVEHDLWAAGEWPPMTGVEALSLILVQFDLTFAWQSGGRSIELTPIPDRVRLEKIVHPKKQTAAKAAAEWSLAWPEAEFQVQGPQVIVWATSEIHEEIAAEMAGRRRSGTVKTPNPLSKQKFSLRIQDTPVQDLMAELEKGGVRFEFDVDELRQAGIELNQSITLDVRMLPADEFFKAVFGPLGLDAEIAGETVTLRVK